jgi:hypothetical protein
MQNLLIPQRLHSVSRGLKSATEQAREERRLKETQAAAERKETTDQDEKKRLSSRRIQKEEMSLYCFHQPHVELTLF